MDHFSSSPLSPFWNFGLSHAVCRITSFVESLHRFCRRCVRFCYTSEAVWDIVVSWSLIRSIASPRKGIFLYISDTQTLAKTVVVWEKFSRKTKHPHLVSERRDQIFGAASLASRRLSYLVVATVIRIDMLLTLTPLHKCTPRFTKIGWANFGMQFALGLNFRHRQDPIHTFARLVPQPFLIEASLFYASFWHELYKA